MCNLLYIYLYTIRNRENSIHSRNINMYMHIELFGILKNFLFFQTEIVIFICINKKILVLKVLII